MFHTLASLLSSRGWRYFSISSLKNCTSMALRKSTSPRFKSLSSIQYLENNKISFVDNKYITNNKYNKVNKFTLHTHSISLKGQIRFVMATIKFTKKGSRLKSAPELIESWPFRLNLDGERNQMIHCIAIRTIFCWQLLSNKCLFR